MTNTHFLVIRHVTSGVIGVARTAKSKPIIVYPCPTAVFNMVFPSRRDKIRPLSPFNYHQRLTQPREIYCQAASSRRSTRHKSLQCRTLRLTHVQLAMNSPSLSATTYEDYTTLNSATTSKPYINQHMCFPTFNPQWPTNRKRQFGALNSYGFGLLDGPTSNTSVFRGRH